MSEYISITPERLKEFSPETLDRVGKQIRRWFDLEPTLMFFPGRGLHVRVDDESPAEWVFLVTALRVGTPFTVETALDLTEKVRKDTIKRRHSSARLLNVPS